MCGSESLQGISTASNVIGTVSQMNAANNQATYKAGIANQNAAISEAQSVSVGQAGSAEQSQIRQKAKQTTGSQKTAFAASGLDTQSGSALSTLSDTALLSEQDVQTSRYNTAMQMWGLGEQTKQYKAEASNAITAGKNASKSALLSGITTAAKQYSA
jgi:hypothetical protein